MKRKVNKFQIIVRIVFMGSKNKIYKKKLQDRYRMGFLYHFDIRNNNFISNTIN